ncbi:Uncharacterized protein FWK35_00016010 [Aphis craccivora]|uniref:C2H2-type domain-containing protein n=1 Tax=Aphis craccivora TaxID=307492 RepID=A0A6G0Y7G9_APHCR|nr:Uncharacterized protein FWK35_00016010 [Aphis craccivora]
MCVVRVHDNVKPFVCVYHERTFRQRETLNQHLRIHSGEKLYGCGYCGKVFRNKAILKKHILTQQDVVHDICGKASKSLRDLIQHSLSADMPLFVHTYTFFVYNYMSLNSNSTNL